MPDTFDLDYAGPFLVVVAAVSVLLLLAWAVSRFLAVGAREMPEQPEPTIPAVDQCHYRDGRAATKTRGPLDNRVPVCDDHAAELDARGPFDGRRSA